MSLVKLRRNRSIDLNSSDGATMIEFALLSPLLVLMIVFILDAAVILFNFSTLTTMTMSLTRHLAYSLGIALDPNDGEYIDDDPWFGSCDEYIEDVGQVWIEKNMRSELLNNRHSMLDSDADFYYGATLKMDPHLGTGALVSNANSPFAILRITGKMKFDCIICRYFTGGGVVDYESSMVIEYRDNNCSDY